MNSVSDKPRTHDHPVSLRLWGIIDASLNPKHTNYAIESEYGDSNRKMAEKDPIFRKACELAGVQPTKRQASKWRNKRGRAYDFRIQAATEKENKS